MYIRMIAFFNKICYSFYMGILSKIKSMFKKDIKLDEKRTQEFVILHKLKKNTLNLETKVTVDEKFCLVFANDGKVYDILPSGEWEINGLTIPKCVKKFKLAKPDKNGNFPKNFKIRLYYVYLYSIVIDFKSYRKLEFIDNNIGRFVASLSGKCTLKVENSLLFMKCLFTVYNHLKQDEVKFILSDWISEFVTDKTQKLNPPIEKLLKNFEIERELEEKLKVKLATYGLNLEKLELDEIKISKKALKKYNTIKEAEEFEEHKKITLSPNTSLPFNIDKSVEFNYNTELDENINLMKKDTIDSNFNNTDTVFTDWTNKTERENKIFVDLNQKSLYDISIKETKICPYCREVNNINNKRCKFCEKDLE